MDLQIKLLRVILERSFQRVGGTEEVRTDARIVASTNRDLEAEVAQNRFRKDLYYRINVIRIEVPPLRERPEDISLLAYHFLRKYAGAFAKEVTGFAEPALEALMGNNWEGNVRELENVIERAVAVSEGGEIDTKDIPPEYIQVPSFTPSGGTLKPFQVAKREFEADYLKRAMTIVRGSVSQAARATNIPRQNLYDKLKRYGISRENYR
jgi:DNA-binding NtrC family response regulator